MFRKKIKARKKALQKERKITLTKGGVGFQEWQKIHPKK